MAYSGNITPGEATIIQGNKPLDFYLRDQQIRGQAGYRQAQAQRQQEQMRNQNFQNLMKTDFGKPGNFQREQTYKEIGEIKDYSRKVAQANENSSLADMENMVGPKRDKVIQRLEKRNEIASFMKPHQDQVKAHPQRYNLDPNSGLPAVLNETLYREGKDVDVDELDQEQVNAAYNHPAATNPDTRLTDSIEDLKGKFSRLELGPEQASALGFMREGALNKARFMTMDEQGNMVPGVSPELVDYTKHVDPSIAEGYRWRLAKQQAIGAGVNPNDLNAVSEIYTNPKFQEESEPYVNEQIKRALEMHQQIEHRDVIQKTGTLSQGQKDAPKEDHYKVTDEQIKAITSSIKDHRIDKSPVAEELIKTLVNKKYTNATIVDAKPVVRTMGDNPTPKDLIHLKLDMGVKQNPKTFEYERLFEDRYIDAHDESALFDLFKSNHETKVAKQMGWNGLQKYRDKHRTESEKWKLKDPKAKTEAEAYKLN